MGAVENTSVPSEAALREVEQLLFREARLLDHNRLDEWLDLFTEDATYWVPLERGQKDPQNTSSIIFDDRTLLEIRVRQYTHPRAHAPADDCTASRGFREGCGRRR